MKRDPSQDEKSRASFNLQVEFNMLQATNLTDADRAKLGVDTKMTLDQVYQAVKRAVSLDAVKAGRQLAIQAMRFIQNYEAVHAAG